MLFSFCGCSYFWKSSIWRKVLRTTLFSNDLTKDRKIHMRKCYFCRRHLANIYCASRQPLTIISISAHQTFIVNSYFCKTSSKRHHNINPIDSGTVLSKRRRWLARSGDHKDRVVRPLPNGHSYCWWTKSCTSKDDDYPIIYRVFYIQVVKDFFHQQKLIHGGDRITTYPKWDDPPSKV